MRPTTRPRPRGRTPIWTPRTCRRTVEREAAEIRQQVAAEREQAIGAAEAGPRRGTGQDRGACWPRRPSTTTSPPSGSRPTSPRRPGSGPRPWPRPSRPRWQALQESEARVAHRQEAGHGDQRADPAGVHLAQAAAAAGDRAAAPAQAGRAQPAGQPVGPGRADRQRLPRPGRPRRTWRATSPATRPCCGPARAAPTRARARSKRTTRRPRRCRSRPARTPKSPAEAKNGGPRAGSGGGKAVPQPEPEVDGDATVLISSNDVPAGTAAPVVQPEAHDRIATDLSARRAGRDDGPAAPPPIACRERGDHLSTPFLGDRRDPSRPVETSSNSDLFPTVRRGYQREVVDRYARKIQADLDQLKRRCEVLRTENTELRAAREETVTMSGPADFTGLGHRAQEILRMAEEQARDVTRRAAREADQLAEETQAELDRRRETVNTGARRAAAVAAARAGDPPPPGRAGRRGGVHPLPDRDRAAARRRPDGGRGREDRVRGDRPLAGRDARRSRPRPSGPPPRRTPAGSASRPPRSAAGRLAELEKAHKEAQQKAARPARLGHPTAARGQRAPDRGDRAGRPSCGWTHSPRRSG